MAWVHRLSNINKELLTADCANCGIGVKVRFLKHKNQHKCEIAIKELNRKRHFKRMYGVAAPINIPKNCSICNSTKRICYDHDHLTGKHRGWICDRCNRTLGLVNDSTELLTKLIIYLEK